MLPGVPNHDPAAIPSISPLMCEPSERLLLDASKDGFVDPSEFLSAFFKEGQIARARALHDKHDEDERLRRKREKHTEDCAAKFASRVAAKIDDEWDDADADAAASKIARVAQFHTRERGADLRHLACCTLDPTSFAKQLKDVLNVRLGARELGALFAHFDRSGDGLVDGAEFLAEFHRLGRAARDAARADERTRAHRRARRERKQQQGYLDKFASKNAARVRWPTLPPLEGASGGAAAAAPESAYEDDDDFAPALDDASAGSASVRSAETGSGKMSKATAEFLEEIEREERKMRRQKKPRRRRRKLPDAIARVG